MTYDDIQGEQLERTARIHDYCRRMPERDGKAIRKAMLVNGPSERVLRRAAVLAALGDLERIREALPEDDTEEHMETTIRCMVLQRRYKQIQEEEHGYPNPQAN